MVLPVLTLIFTCFLYSVIALQFDKGSGFDCGRVFFGKNAIKNAGSLVSQNLMNSAQTPLAQNYPILEEKPNHVCWPIRESGKLYGTSRSKKSFYIVVDYSGRVKEVIARLSNNDFTKCLKKDQKSKDKSQALGVAFKCGQELFEVEQLRDDAAEAMSKVGKGSRFPSPYMGNLYQRHDYLTWPILSKENGDDEKNREASPFHLILSRSGEIIDVVAKLKANDFIKCERLAKKQLHKSKKRSLLERRNIVTDFNCGTRAYAKKYLLLSQGLAKTPNPANSGPQNFPKEITTAPCPSGKCKLWPIFPQGRTYVNGAPGTDFILMDERFNFIAAVQTVNGVLSRCTPGSSNGAATGNKNAQVGVPGAGGQVLRNNRGEFTVPKPGAVLKNNRGEFTAPVGGVPPNFRQRPQ